MAIKPIKNIVVRQGNAKSIDARSATLATVETSTGKKPNVINPIRDYGHRTLLQRSEYNLVEIGVIEDVESYVRQSFQKKTALMFKEGEKLTGKNKDTIDYLKKRFLQMEYVSGMPWRLLLRETGYALISRSNYFWVKVRRASASGGAVIGGVQPVAAYFGLGPEHITVKRNTKGVITHYRQEMPDGRVKEYPARDVIHFHAYRKPGFTFGTPAIVPVKDDIRALRRIEENVELMIYQHLFPIFQYKVGTETKPAGDIRLDSGHVISEVDYVREQIANMPAEGGIVTPERHEIKFIGADKQVLKAKEYLDYFKQRVFTGLGVSGVDLGEGGTANRATADSMSRALVDCVKDYQDILEEFINKEVIQDLLIESTFNFDVLDEANIVRFKFQEIDIEEQMKKNTNAQVLYNGDIIDVNEAREYVGKEPLANDQEELMYTERVTMKTAEMQGNMQLEIANTKTQAAANQAKNSNAPTNQNGKKTGPQKSRLDYVSRDSFAGDTIRMVRNDVAQHIKSSNIDRKWINVLVGMAKDRIKAKYVAETTKKFQQGLRDSGLDASAISSMQYDYSEVENHLAGYLDKLSKDIRGRIYKTLDRLVDQNANRREIAKEVSAQVDAIKYRADFMDTTEKARAYNYGKALGLKEQGFKKAELIKNKDCEQCALLADDIDLTNLSLSSVPPFHPNSTAKVGKGIEVLQNQSLEL
jgi:hypothetical protein